jgi:hypothetical protein
MTVIMPPMTGEDVNILAPPNARLRGHVTDRGPEGLTVELEQSPIWQPFRFAFGSEVAVEWIHPLGLMQLSARVERARDDPRPTLELDFVGAPERADRRKHARIPVELEVSAWSLVQSMRRFSGNTIDLSVGGALLWLPDLTPLTATLEVWIGLPKPLQTSAGVRWRRDPLVGVQFEGLGPEQQSRLVDFLRTLNPAY